jgi:hypothetical protein
VVIDASVVVVEPDVGAVTVVVVELVEWRE